MSLVNSHDLVLPIQWQMSSYASVLSLQLFRELDLTLSQGCEMLLQHNHQHRQCQSSTLPIHKAKIESLGL